MTRAGDIEARITLVPTADGGRQGPAQTGFRPQFRYEGHDWDAVHDFVDKEWLYPGETAVTHVTFLSPDAHVGRMVVGTKFELCEGQRVIGAGVVTRILELKKSARNHGRTVQRKR